MHTVPESYLISTNKTFSNEVRKLLEKLETQKATDVDNLPLKMFKHPWMAKW